MVILFWPSITGFAQGPAITGKLLEMESKEPLVGATVGIFKQGDSILVSGTVTDLYGSFEFKSVPAGNYQLDISFIGFMPLQIPLIVSGDHENLGTLFMDPSIILLDEATVTGRRSALVTELDKKVYNVQQDIMAESATVSEILQNIPSVSVDIDGNITLRNSGNITFFMNGKPSAMLRRNPGTVLQQMPANSIERIEIITNPSAKYRPDGVGGIINIVTSKNTREGLSGQATVNGGTEKRYNGYATLNYGTENLELFSNYGIRHSAGTRIFMDNRIYKDPESGLIRSIYDESGNSNSGGFAHTLFLGGKYQMNDHNSIEIATDFFLQNSFHTGLSEISTRDSLDQPETNFNDKTTNDEFEEEGEVSLGYEHIFNNNEDHTLSIEATYSAFDESEQLQFDQQFSFPNNEREITGNLVEKNGRQNEILLDYTLPFGEDGEFEGGYAGEIVLEDIRYTGEASTSRFILNRQVHAAYALLGLPIESFSFKAGIRAEQSILDSHLRIPTDTLISDSYLKFFPTLHLGFEINDNNKLLLSYSKRINRPDADELNPNPEFSDPRNAESGNPYLKPEQIHSLDLGYHLSMKSMEFNSSLYYRYKYDAFTSIRSNVGDSVVLRSIANLNTQDALGLEMIISGDITENWNYNLTGNVYYTTLDASNLGYSGNKSSLSGNLKLYSLLKLWKGTFIQVNGFYYFPTITPQGMRNQYFYLNGGIKQQLCRNRASLTLTASDIFHTYKSRNRIETDELDQSTIYKRKMQVVYLGFTWRFRNYREPAKLEFEGEF